MIDVAERDMKGTPGAIEGGGAPMQRPESVDEHNAALGSLHAIVRNYAQSGDLDTFQLESHKFISEVQKDDELAQSLHSTVYDLTIYAIQDFLQHDKADSRAEKALFYLSHRLAENKHIAENAERVIDDLISADQGTSEQQQKRAKAIQMYCEAAGYNAVGTTHSPQTQKEHHLKQDLISAINQHKGTRVAGIALAAGLFATGPAAAAAASELSTDVQVEVSAQTTSETPVQPSTIQNVELQSEVTQAAVVGVTMTAQDSSAAEAVFIGNPSDTDQAEQASVVVAIDTQAGTEALEPVMILEEKPEQSEHIGAANVSLVPVEQQSSPGDGDAPSDAEQPEAIIVQETIVEGHGVPELQQAEAVIAPPEENTDDMVSEEPVVVTETEEAMPDPDPNPKPDETPQDTIERVAHSGDMDNTTLTILNTYSEKYKADPESVSPPNATLDTWVKEKREGLVEAVTVAAHDDSYTQDAIKAIAFLNAVQKDPGVLKDKEVQEYIAALPDMGDKYVDKLYKEHLKSAQELLASDELGKSEGLDEATLEALSKLYAYVDLATQSDTEQTERIDAIKAEEEAERKRQEEEQKRQEAKGQEQSGYSEKAIAAGKKVAKEYDAEIDAMIAAFDRLDPAKKQFMHDMVDEIEELDPDELPVNITITFAQGILESSWGQSTLASDYYNLFGMKAGSTWTGDTVDLPTREVYNGESVKVMATWAVFEDYGESFEHYAYGLIGALDRYEAATEVKDDPYKYLQAIKAAGYATDPEYVNIVWSVAETYTQDIVAKIYEKEAAVQKAMDGVKAQEQKTAKEEAAKKEAAKKAEDEEQRKREQSGDIRSQLQEAAPIIASLKDKYGDVSGKMSDSDLVSTPGLHKNGNSVTIRLHPAAMKGYEALAAAFKKEFGKEIRLTDWYRTYDTQVKVKKKKGDYAATPGKSFHGWGFAIDFASDINIESTPEHEWMEANSYKFGWINPIWAHDSRGIEEPWHWEYVGPSAREAISQEL